MESVKLAFDTTADAAAMVRICSSTDGIRSFWTDAVEGDAAQGGRFELRFPGPAPVYVLETVTVGDGEVVWRCVEGPESWIGTTMRFAHAGPHPMGIDGALIAFQHDGWGPEAEGLPWIAYIWAQILARLKATMETGANAPFFET